MTQPKTDRSQSISASEYLWDVPGMVEAHAFLGPKLMEMLGDRRGLRLLDIGCGNGSLTAAIALHSKRCVGVDFSESGIAIAREHYPSVEFQCAEISKPLPRELHGCFDVVVAVEVVEHLLLPRQLFDRAREALVERGRLIVTTPFHGYAKNLALAVANKLDSHYHPLRDYGHVKFFSRKTLAALFEEKGFEVTRFERVGRIPIFARSMLIEGRLLPIQ